MNVWLKNHWQLVAIWLVCGAISVYCALLPREASLLDGIYHFSTYDSFYHARLILETLIGFPAIVEFDRYLHPLEGGSWISVAWGYDYLVAIITQAVLLVLPQLPVNTLLTHIAPLWSALNCLLVIGICSRLGLERVAIAIAATVFALSPAMQDTHLVGNIDHHFLELSFILLVIFSALGWINRPESTARAVLVGLVMGLSHAIHIGLFVMYLPLAVFLFVAWIQGNPVMQGKLRVVAVTTLVASLAALAPSQHFLRLDFAFHYTSWFHVYWSLAFCLCVLFMQRFAYDRRNLALLVLLGAVLSVPLLDSLVTGTLFVASDLPGFERIEETVSLWRYLFSGEPALYAQLYSYYSGLLFLVPIALILLARHAFREQRPDRLYFLFAVVLGAVLLFSQLRFKYHAVYVLAIPMLILVQDAWQASRQTRWSASLLVLALCFIGPIQALQQTKPLGGQAAYRALFPFYQAMQNVCGPNPGVLLAHPDEGHYLRYYTNCRIVANNLLATRRDFEYRAMANDLLQMPLQELLRTHDWVDYIYVRREDGMNPNLTESQVRAVNRGLREDILLTPQPLDVAVLLEFQTDAGPFLRMVQPAPAVSD